MTAKEKSEEYALKFDTIRDAILAIDLVIGHLALDEKQDLYLIKYWDDVKVELTKIKE